MATTTNYGWTTPDDTALVKDGAAAIRTLGSSVDTTTKALNPSTTLGDIEYRSSTANTNTRLGIGTTGQVLTVSGGVPSWATSASGGMTLISTTSLTGASVSLSSIPQTYVNLYLIVQDYLPATDDDHLECRINGDTTGSRHYAMQLDGDVSGNGAKSFDSNSFRISSDNDNAVAQGISTITFPNYTNTVTWKYAKVESIGVGNVTTTQFIPANYFGVYNQTGAISSLDLFSSGGNMTSGTALLYGVK